MVASANRPLGGDRGEWAPGAESQGCEAAEKNATVWPIDESTRQRRSTGLQIPLLMFLLGGVAQRMKTARITVLMKLLSLCVRQNNRRKKV
ncbi:MAG TPA: hypothetical protein VGQ99_12450 [Tepidisphaeraceae bacterium]|jgi:hypothetical protein|nr:hypothetical protein [Tepidisphaeraceae bacterium]